MSVTFLKKRLKSFAYAFRGAAFLLRKGVNFQVQCIIGGAVIFAGFYFDITPTEWMFQVFAIGLVLSLEGLNTAVEELANFVHPDYHHKIGYIKDLAAGAVFIAALAAAVIGFIIYLPYIF